MSDVLVLGGGIVGLLSALELTKRDLNVTVIDGGPPPASWAGGGILSPLFAWRHSSFLNRLTHDGVSRYQALVLMLEESGFLDRKEVLHLGGMWVQVAGPELTRAQRWAEAWGMDCHEMESPGSRIGHGAGGLFFPGLGNIRNPRMLKALRAYLAAKGVGFVREYIRRVELLSSGAKLHGEIGQYRSDTVVVAAGYNAAALLAETGVSVPLFPAKGEMLLFQVAPGDVPSVILTEAGYLIPRADGAVLVGSTLRKGDASHYPTVQGRHQLISLAARLSPVLAEKKPSYHWAGVRPGCERDYPYLGLLPGAKGVYVAAGHYRNGLVSAPGSAELLAQLICGESPFTDPEPYSLSSASPSSRSSSSFFNR